MTKYIVGISEQQRALILAALDASLNHARRGASYDGTVEDEPYVLRELFYILPDEEAESVMVGGNAPGTTVHSFTD